jgi:hypothetical protein
MLPLRLDTVPLRLPLTLLLPRRAPEPPIDMGSSSPHAHPVDVLAVDDSDPFFFMGLVLESDVERRRGIGAPLASFFSKEPKS